MSAAFAIPDGPAENPREAIGGNNPPEPTPFDIASNTADALFEEAKHWVDGGAIETQAEADAIGMLLDQARKATKLADANRVIEKKPHDDAGKAVQERYKPILSRVELVEKACKKALGPWLEAVEAEKRRVAHVAREKADEEAAAARKAVQEATDLEAKEAAETLLRASKKSETVANRAEKDKASAVGGARAVTLRSTYRAEITDPAAFARFVWTNHFDELEAFLQGTADRLVKNGQRSIDGVTVHVERSAV